MASLFKEFAYLDYVFPAPQYLGAKYRFRSWIQQFLPKGIRTAVDPFGGSMSVAYFLKQLGYRVFANDFMAFSAAIGTALVENREDRLERTDVEMLFSENPDPHAYDLMRRIFTDVFFVESDTAFLDSYRGNVDRLKNPRKRALALAVMNRALTRKVTMGHFAHTQALAYAANPERVKRNRSLARPVKDIVLDLIPEYNAAVFDNGADCSSHRGDAVKYVAQMKNVDLAYFDPPYGSSHADYQQFYHLLETYTEYWKDKSFVNGVKRYEPRRETGFDKKVTVLAALETLFENAKDIPYWLLSYNDRSYPDVDTLASMVGRHRRVRVERKTYRESRGGKGSVAGSNEILIIGEP